MASNDLELMAEERVYEEQELGAKFDPSTGKRMYHNYQVLRVLPKTEEDLSVLRFLEKGLFLAHHRYIIIMFSQGLNVEKWNVDSQLVEWRTVWNANRPNYSTFQKIYIS